MPKAKIKDKTKATIELQIIPSKEIVSERIYSNFVTVNHSPYDFTLTFCDILPIDDTQKIDIEKIKKLNAPIQAEIVIPTPLVEPLIKALSENYETYKKNIMPK